MKHIFSLGAIGAAILIACAPAAAAPAKAAVAHTAGATQSGKRLDQLASQYYEAVARFEPVGATENGDGRLRV